MTDLLTEIAGMMGSRAAGGVISNGSSTDFDCDSFTGWTDLDIGNAVSSLCTFDSRSAFCMDGGATYNGSNAAQRLKILAAPAGDRNVVSFVIYPEDLIAGGPAGGTAFLLLLYGCGLRTAYLAISSDSIWQSDGIAWNLVASVDMLDAWHTITLDITSLSDSENTVFDVYLGNDLLGSNFTPNTPDNTLGYTGIIQYSRVNDLPTYIPKLSYIDRILIGDDFA